MLGKIVSVNGNLVKIELTIDTCEKYNKYKDYMSDATIFVKYLGNSKFDGYRIISSHKVSDMPEYNKLCN